jgi:hypothetical protein
MRLISALTAVAVLWACRPAPEASARTSGTATTTAGVVDSAIPREEALRRFRQGIPPVDTLTGGADSRDALVRGFVAAVEQADTATLRRLLMTRQEFAWIYYPDNPQGLPPYDLSPGLLWFLLDNRGAIGLSHLMQERVGTPLRYVRYQCDSLPSMEGENRVWGPCVIARRQAGGDLLLERLFGPILERRGRFKFVNYANKLD